MNIEEKKPMNQESNELLCISCKSFYGNEAFGKMCSQCYKNNQSLMTPKRQEKNKIQEPALQPIIKEVELKEEKVKINKDRCLTCNRRLKLLGIECKCGNFFCNKHRLPEQHQCAFNHKQSGKERLTKELVNVDKGKIESI